MTMDMLRYTTVTIERKTLALLKETNENHRSANALIQDLVKMHNHIKNDMRY